jgi:hypothetical protein
MTKTELLGRISRALTLYDSGFGVEHQADVAFGKLVDFADQDFSEDEWRSFYDENDRLFALLKDDKNRQRNAYEVGLLQHAFKIVEARP